MSQYQGVGFNDSVSIPDDIFVLNPTHEKMVTGRRNWGHIWKQYGIGAGFTAFFFIIIILIALPSFTREIQLATQKTGQVKGQVVDHRISRGSKSTSYYITYEFVVNGQAFHKEESITSGEYNQYEVGGNAPITYLVSDPNTSHVGESGIRWNDMFPMIIMGGFSLFFLAIILGSGIPHSLKIRRMKREGQLILGQLKSSSSAYVKRGSGKSRRTDYDVTIYYEFTTPYGRKVITNSTLPRNDLKNKELPTSGTVAVLYVNDDDYLVL